MLPSASPVSLLLVWGSVESLSIKFVHPLEIFTAFPNNAGSVCSHGFYICIQMIVQMFVLPSVVWKLLLRRNWTYEGPQSFFFLRSWLSCLDFPMYQGENACYLKVGQSEASKSH